LPAVSPLLNLGSSTRQFREVIKPHIEMELFAPLREAGVKVIHSDSKKDEGVDIAGDILAPELMRRLNIRKRQLCRPALRADFPPLAARDRVPHTLPVELEDAGDVGLHHPDEVGVAEVAAQGAQRGCRHHSIADPSGENDRDFHDAQVPGTYHSKPDA